MDCQFVESVSSRPSPQDQIAAMFKCPCAGCAAFRLKVKAGAVALPRTLDEYGVGKMKKPIKYYRSY